jgi:hypothetical protein
MAETIEYRSRYDAQGKLVGIGKGVVKKMPIEDMQDIERAGYRPDLFAQKPPTEASGQEQLIPTIPGKSRTPADKNYGKPEFDATLTEDITGMLDGRLDFKEIVSPVVQFVLYNPANFTIHQDYNGYTYTLPPHNKIYYPGLGPGECPVTDGVEAVGDKSGIKKRQPIPARLIMRFLLGPDGRSGELGGRGVRSLFRDHRDVLVKAEAQRVFQAAHYTAMRYIAAAHELRTKHEREQGVPLTPPTFSVQQAYQYIRWYEAEHGTIDAPISRFPCTKCGWAHDNAGDRDAHIMAMHPNYAIELGLTSDIPRTADEANLATESAHRAMAAELGETSAEAENLAPIPAGVFDQPVTAPASAAPSTPETVANAAAIAQGEAEAEKLSEEDKRKLERWKSSKAKKD